MTSAAKYAHDDAEGDRPMKVCAEAGRKCVRNIHQYPILSADWLALIDSLKQLTRLVQLESRMPSNTKVAEAHGRNKDSEGTLWDQEAHENAIRILVEEAKVSLCLRMMHDYKRWQYNIGERQSTLHAAMQAFGQSDAQLEQKCKQFEESLGTLLWRSFMHVETLQLCDLPLLVEHMAFIFDLCKRATVDTMADKHMQETVIMCYFSCLMKHAEHLNNGGELLAKMRELRVVHLAVDHVLTYGDRYDSEVRIVVAEGFAALADNEDFRTDWEGFFAGDVDAMLRFLALEDRFVAPILQANPGARRELRPLLDFFNLLKRSVR